MLTLCFGFQNEQEGRDEILKYNSVGNFDNRTQETPFGKDAQTEQRHASEFLYPTLVSLRYQMKHFTAWLIHKTCNTTQYPLHHTIDHQRYNTQKHN